jgi:cell division topological specificity factor
MLDFINRMLGLSAPSASTAKQRLQLVLAHDRSDLNPELMEQMRREILEVVQRYVEIDIDEGDVTLETEDRVTALVANLPIKRARPLQPTLGLRLASAADAINAGPSSTAPNTSVSSSPELKPPGEAGAPAPEADTRAPMPAWVSANED